MLLAYLDESYTTTEYYIAALLVPEAAAIPLGQALDQVVRNTARKFGDLADRAELHGHELFHGKGDWEPLKGLHRARIGAYMDAMAAIGQQSVEIILEGVDVPRLNARYSNPDSPHQCVLRHTLERIDERARTNGELVTVVADEVDGQSDYRRDLWHFQRYSTGGYRPRQLTTIVDTMHFVPSHVSRLVQAADLIAFMHRRLQTVVEPDLRAARANAKLWSVVEERVVHQRLWRP